ncbi:MAG: biopolymer transporter ExbD [Roseovarius sp.]
MRRSRRLRRLSMTSLIDVIFLLLLFFMLSSTFSKFSEIELSAAAGAGAPADARPLFVQLRASDVTLNGEAMALEALGAALRARPEAGEAQPLLIALGDAVTSQRLADLLVLLRGIAGISPTVLGDS